MKRNNMSYMKSLSNEQKCICQIERIEPNYALIINSCGDFAPFNLKYTEKVFVVTFVSDSIHNARGFYLSWKGPFYF